MAKRAAKKRLTSDERLPAVPSTGPTQTPNSFRKLIEVFDQERRLLAYEIHDGVVQDIIGAKMLADSLLEQRPECRADLLPLCKLLSAAIEEARRLVRELRPIVIDEMGLVAALQFLINEERPSNRLTVQFEHDPDFPRMSPTLEGALFRIAQEALTNARRHSRASEVAIRLSRQDPLVRLDVTDDGVGFEPALVPANRYGLEGIRERARLLGGTTLIQSAPMSGTLVRVEIPLELAEPARSKKRAPSKGRQRKT